MGLGIGQCSGSKTDIICGELARATWFWLDIIVVLEFSMPAIDARHCTPVYVEFLGDGIISHPSILVMNNAGLLGG